MKIEEIRDALRLAQEKIGFDVPADVAVAVYSYAIRKCLHSGKDSSYIAVLFETELVDYFTRLAININGGANHVYVLS